MIMPPWSAAPPCSVLSRFSIRVRFCFKFKISSSSGNRLQWWVSKMLTMSNCQLSKWFSETQKSCWSSSKRADVTPFGRTLWKKTLWKVNGPFVILIGPFVKTMGPFGISVGPFGNFIRHFDGLIGPFGKKDPLENRTLWQDFTPFSVFSANYSSVEFLSQLATRESVFSFFARERWHPQSLIFALWISWSISVRKSWVLNR